MRMTFASVVDEVQQLSFDEQSELRDLIEKYMIEARRAEILKSAEEGMREYERGELIAYDNVDDLIKPSMIRIFYSSKFRRAYSPIPLPTSPPSSNKVSPENRPCVFRSLFHWSRS